MHSKSVRDKFKKRLTLWIAQQGRCWLCGDTMAKPIIGAPGGNQDPEYPTIDHVVPASQGGDRSFANIMLAHARCNSARGNNAEVRAVRTS